MMTPFPPWVENPKHPAVKRAALRLKFKLTGATLYKFGKPSINELAKHIEYDHSSIFCAIARGWFTEEMATAIVEALDNKQITVDFLRNPLGLVETT